MSSFSSIIENKFISIDINEGPKEYLELYKTITNYTPDKNDLLIEMLEKLETFEFYFSCNVNRYIIRGSDIFNQTLLYLLISNNVEMSIITKVLNKINYSINDKSTIWNNSYPLQDHNTVLHLACFMKNYELVELLIKHPEINLNYLNDPSNIKYPEYFDIARSDLGNINQTPLHILITNLKELIINSGYINQTDNIKRLIRVIMLFVNNDAQTDIKTIVYNTYFDIKSKSVIKMLQDLLEYDNILSNNDLYEFYRNLNFRFNNIFTIEI